MTAYETFVVAPSSYWNKLHKYSPSAYKLNSLIDSDRRQEEIINSDADLSNKMLSYSMNRARLENDRKQAMHDIPSIENAPLEHLGSFEKEQQIEKEPIEYPEEKKSEQSKKQDSIWDNNKDLGDEFIDADSKIESEFARENNYLIDILKQYSDSDVFRVDADGSLYELGRRVPNSNFNRVLTALRNSDPLKSNSAGRKALLRALAKIDSSKIDLEKLRLSHSAQHEISKIRREILKEPAYQYVEFSSLPSTSGDSSI